jgi:hypothetical protein
VGRRASVFDLDEEETSGGCGGTGGGAIAGGEDGGDVVGGDAAAGGFDEGADEVADHVVKEAGTGDAVDEEAVAAMPGGVVDGAGVWGGFDGDVLFSEGFPQRLKPHSWGGLNGGTEVPPLQNGAFFSILRGLCFCAGGEVGVYGGEGGEVVGAADVVGGVLEDGEVEREGAVPDVGSEGRRADAFDGEGGWVGDAGEDAVLVGLAEGVVAGVEGFGCVLDGEDADAGGKGVVEGAMEVGGGDGDGEREGGDLGKGVDAGVGAAGALREDGLSGDALDGFGEGSLHGGEIGLDLPAVVGGSVVGESGFPVRHGDVRTVSRGRGVVCWWSKENGNGKSKAGWESLCIPTLRKGAKDGAPEGVWLVEGRRFAHSRECPS